MDQLAGRVSIPANKVTSSSMFQSLDTQIKKQVHKVSGRRWACSRELCMYSSPHSGVSWSLRNTMSLPEVRKDGLSACWVSILPIPVAILISPKKLSSFHFIQYSRNCLSWYTVFLGGICYTHWMVSFLGIWLFSSVPTSPESVCLPACAFIFSITKAHYSLPCFFTVKLWVLFPTP